MNRITDNAFIIHKRKYSETSLIITALTKEHGKTNLIAKGALRHKSKFSGLLEPFTNLAILFTQSNLPTLVNADLIQFYDLPYKVLSAGLYINELVYKIGFVHHNEPLLFALYQKTLSALASSVLDSDIVYSVAVALRLFEKELLTLLGYGINFLTDINGNPLQSSSLYHYQVNAGFLQVNDGIFVGEGLIELGNNVIKKSQMASVKKLLQFCLHEVLGKEVNSGSYFRQG